MSGLVMSDFDRADDRTQIRYFIKAMRQLQGTEHTDADIEALAEQLFNEESRDQDIEQTGIYDPTGIGNPADYMQSIKFTDSDENGKPESVEEGSDDPNVLSDKGLKAVRDKIEKKSKDIRQKRIDHFKENWGETNEMKRRKGKQ